LNAISRIADAPAAQIFRVATENVEPLWPQIEPLLQVELANIPTHDVDDVRGLILGNRCHLWVQWSDHVEAMAVTEFDSFPRGVALRVWLGAANEADRLDGEGFRTTLTQWAARNHCKWIMACGRIGWLRRFPDAKFAGVMMRLTVDWGAA